VDFVLSCTDQVQGGEIFVPKIASMSLMELAKTIGPECKFEFCGMRPGEKLHETLVPRDESPWCLEFPDRYVIQPSQLWWDPQALIKRGGTPVAEGFRYRSDVNDNWLSGDELCKLIAKSQDASNLALR
jgi:UDP-N-acetylglucosamine 4,6-dehydratase